jgi:hypothetical protein
VADIINPAKDMNRKCWKIAFNKISSKHFDFVLCSKDKLEVIAVIELDDKSHYTKKAVSRDALLNNVCKSASLKLVRFQARPSYQIQSIRDQVELAINPEAIVSRVNSVR